MFRKRVALISALIAFAVLLAGFSPASAQTEYKERYVPKAENFIFFVDYSGSMSMTHDTVGVQKMTLAKEVMATMNQEIPELGYGSALSTFAPYSQLHPASGATTYNTQEFGEAIGWINEDYDVFMRLTPMGRGISSLEPTVGQMPNDLAVIIFSDGEHNLGPEPVDQAKAIYDKYPGVCFHVVSFADSAEGRETLERIAALKGCSVMAYGPDLLEDRAMLNQFVQDVFYTRIVEKIEKEEPKPEPKPEPEPVEEVVTFRGVNFDFDKSNIREDMQPVLNEAARIIKDHDGTVVLSGHTDSIGTQEYNMGLSKRRAESVKEYLVNRGVRAGRIELEWYGESRPKYTNETSEGRALNRRVEIELE
jgi:OOP family OmpA-OmpF porin